LAGSSKAHEADAKAKTAISHFLALMSKKEGNVYVGMESQKYTWNDRFPM
jgi:hypothetical protein